MSSIDLTGDCLPGLVPDSPNVGVQVTDTERGIVYGNKAAQPIIGRPADQILGRRCLDQVLCHVDKDGRELCGGELFPADGGHSALDLSGLPMGCVEDMEYDQIDCQVEAGDRRLLFSDGAVEIRDAGSRQLGADGLLGLLREMQYPASDLHCAALEQRMLTCSNRIRFDDDLTFLEIRFESGGSDAG